VIKYAEDELYTASISDYYKVDKREIKAKREKKQNPRTTEY
jgi:hypothetical protein